MLEKQKMNGLNRRGKCLLGMILIFYCLFLMRVILFRQVSIDNLAAAVGAGNRSVNLIPFHSVMQIISSDVSALRMTGSLVGNAALFLPLGLLLPLICSAAGVELAGGYNTDSTDAVRQKKWEKKKESGSAGKFFCAAAVFGAAVSGCLETIQYLLRMGGSDIDDVILGAAGAAAGYGIYLLIFRVSRYRPGVFPSVAAAALALVLLLAGCGLLAAWDSGCFLMSVRDSSIRNAELVESFADTKPAVRGGFVSFSGSDLTVGSRLTETERRETYRIEENSEIYVRRITLDCLFGTVIGEYTAYEKLEVSSLRTESGRLFGECNMIEIWSADGRYADYVLVTVIS